ncbi:MAG: succinate dehydrogenase cytochrome b subunit [Chitinophagaceae bacterium]|nr:succinate dehydrogenase cytochrome b subunit [Chitinophagaceae bacterium]
MTWKQHFTSSVGKKLVMAFTGLFLIMFLVIHAYLNAMIFLPDGREKFEAGAHFMGTNPLTRILEIGLVLGFALHIIQGLMLWRQNAKKRSAGRYAVNAGNATSKWYSRSMGLLGTIVLLFLVIHTAHFWIPNRANQFMTGEEIDLYEKMQIVFENPIVVALYVLGCLSLCFHLVHGFYSAFQTLGMGTSRYKSGIRNAGIAFSIIITILFALMPIAFHFNILLG